MKLQNILFPELDGCSDETLFFRAPRQNGLYYDYHERQFVFQGIGHCSFDTYFNAFSAGKWKKYTKVDKVDLKLQLKGHFHIILTHVTGVPFPLEWKVLDNKEFHSEDFRECTLSCDLPSSGLIALELISLEEQCFFKGGWFEAPLKEEELAEVRLGLNICTYKREKFITANLKKLEKAFFKNPESELAGHLQVFIQDNGNTLPLKEINSESVHLVYNKNAGGAAGFTRGILEIMANKDFDATHVLMMDDDIMILPEAIFRTYTLLRCRREKYRDVFIGGAMLRLDSPAIQHEAGASWNAGALISNKCGFDLRSTECILANEKEDYCEFNAWWYCCTPMSVITPENLPLPFFIRGDDLEYGLRNMKSMITLNGICVWHETFENKYSSYLSYYILRNLLFCNALHFPEFGAWDALYRINFEFFKELTYYRYKNLELILRAVRDFLRGSKFFLSTDGAKLHQEIMAQGYKQLPAEADLNLSAALHYTLINMKPETRFDRILRVITINGLFLPTKKTRRIPAVAPMGTCRPNFFYRQKKVFIYDATSEKYFTVEKQFLTSLKYLFRLLFLEIRVIFCYGYAKRKFRKTFRSVVSETFWERYLDEAPSKK